MALLGLLVITSMILGACAAPAPTTEAPAEETEAEATEAPEATEEPRTTRVGGWLDEIDFSVVDSESAISQVEAGAIDLYSFGLASDKFSEILASGLKYTASFGGYYDILFNPAVFTDATHLNPFSSKKVREAMNWLIDRDFVNQEIYGGGSLPKYTPLTTQLVDYTNVIDVARGVEALYAYNPDRAAEAIAPEMEAMGATMGADGKWQFNGEPVTLIFIIRNDGDGTRLPLGDYVSNQLESIGFTVDRQYKPSSEASPIWIGSDPLDGLWHLYTAGWLPSGLSRDEGNIFNQMYAPNSIQGLPVIAANTGIDARFQELADALIQNTFTSVEERTALLSEALPLALQDSLQVWVIDQQQYAVMDPSVEVTYDVAAGIEPARMPPYTLRFSGEEGGQMRVGTNDIFTEPWNPVLGSNWVWDNWVQSTTRSAAFMPDPYTGLVHPHHVESAEVTVQTGLPVAASLDWVTLDFADEITVPADAWGGWDATAQTFTPVGEGVTTKTKTVLHYPADLWETVKWHDGSNLSIADFVLTWIMAFDPADPASAIYDEAQAAVAEAFKATFKGLALVSTDPLVIEVYSDQVFLDAELIAATGLAWPIYSGNGSGAAPWQMVAVSNAAEANGELAYSPDKSGTLEVEQTSYVGGPSLDILTATLATMAADGTIPYEPTMSQYLTADEAAARYASTQAWYEAHGHYWIGTGPYFLDRVDLTAKTAVVLHNPDFPQLADTWSDFSSPKLADVAVEGPAQVTVGEEAVFNVTLTLRETGEAYASADVAEVKFLVYNEAGETVYVGTATDAGGDGLYTATIPADVTGSLVAGTGSIEVAAVLIPVAIPAFTTVDYVVVE
jgi:peptide/nickel transport system substrate-binding protein